MTAQNDVDFHLVLSFGAAILPVARADCFCSLQVDRVQDLPGDSVRVMQSHLKGEVPTEEHVLV